MNLVQAILWILAFAGGIVAIVFGAISIADSDIDRYCLRLGVWLFSTGIVAFITVPLYWIASCSGWYYGGGRWALMVAIVMTFVGLVPLSIIGVDVTIHAHDAIDNCGAPYIISIVVIVLQFLILLSFVSWIPGIVDAEKKLQENLPATLKALERRR